MNEICSTCGFDQGSCQPLPTITMQAVQGPFFARATLPVNNGAPSDDILEDEIDIFGAHP